VSTPITVVTTEVVSTPITVVTTEVVSTPMPLVCGTSCAEGSNYSLVPTPKGHNLLQ